MIREDPVPGGGHINAKPDPYRIQNVLLHNMTFKPYPCEQENEFHDFCEGACHYDVTEAIDWGCW